MVLAICVSMPFWDEVWLSIAYEKHELVIPSPFQNEYKNREVGLQYFTKKTPWLPGKRASIHDQLCQACRGGQHSSCHLGWVFFAPLFFEDEDIAPLSITSLPEPHGDIDAYCTCPDPSHKDKP